MWLSALMIDAKATAKIPPPNTAGYFHHKWLYRFALLVQVDEHQRVQEQYQDSAHIHNKINNGQELGIQ